MLMTHNVQDLFVFQKLKMRNDTFCFMPYFQLYETILFLLLIHLGLRMFAILSNTLLLNVDMSIKKKCGIYRCPQPNYDSFLGKVFSRYI